MRYDDFKTITKPAKKALNKAKAASVDYDKVWNDAKKAGRGKWVVAKPTPGYGPYSDHDDGIMHDFVVDYPIVDQAKAAKAKADDALRQAVADLMKTHKSALVQVLSDWGDITSDLSVISLKHKLHYALQDSVNPTLSNLRP